MYTPVLPFWLAVLVGVFSGILGGGFMWFVVNVGANFATLKRRIVIVGGGILIALITFAIVSLPSLASS